MPWGSWTIPRGEPAGSHRWAVPAPSCADGTFRTVGGMAASCTGTQDVRRQPVVAEGAARVELLHEGGEVGVPLVARRQFGGVGEEELAPVRARAERRQRGLQLRQNRLDGGLIPLPGEVEADGVLAVG